MAIFLSKEGFNHFFIQFDNDGQWKSHLAKIESTSKKVFPEYPFEFRFVKDDYQKNFEGIRSTGKMANAFALLAVFISCLGLFGLSAFFAEKRTKEIGIRKVLGASVAGLWMFSFQRFFQTSFIGFCANRSAGHLGHGKAVVELLNIAPSFPGRFLPLQGWWPSEFQSLP
jgi:putative ABC transport system permease protein